MTRRVGITADLHAGRYRVGVAYADMVVRAGATPLILPCIVDAIPAYLECCDAFVLTGGDDPDMTAWGEPMHPRATPIDPRRQRFETALLEALDRDGQWPVLGVCLGMQLMALHRGGRLDQYLPDTLPTAAEHWGRRDHVVEGSLGAGAVHSHHRQAIVEPGGLEVVARAADGVIEAIRDPARAYYVGVQWHPERTVDPGLGQGVFDGLVRAVEACSVGAPEPMLPASVTPGRLPGLLPRSTHDASHSP